MRLSQFAGNFLTGIKSRLYTALGIVVLGTVVSSVVAWIALSSTASTLDKLTGESAPAVVDALQLSEVVSRIAAVAPELAAANTHEGEKAAWLLLSQSSQRMTDIAAAGRVSSEAQEMLSDAQAQLTNGLAALRKQVVERIDLVASRQEQINQLRKSHKNVLSAIAPIVDNINFELIIGADDVDVYAENAVSAFVEAGVGPLVAALEVKSETNGIVGLLNTAANEDKHESIEPLRERFTAAVASLQSALEVLKDQDGLDEVKEHIASLIELGGGDNSIFDLRVAELRLRDAIALQLASARELSSEFGGHIAGIVEITSTRMASASARSKNNARANKTLLLTIAVISVLAALLISYFYVGRNLVRRLVGLSDVMVELADGNIDLEINDKGRDELSLMAGTVNVFKQNAIDRIRLEQEQEQAKVDAENQRKSLMEKLAGEFDASVGGVVVTVSDAANAMDKSASSMSMLSESTRERAVVVSAASQEASVNVQAVASAAEELTSSTSEINQQVARSAAAAQNAVTLSADTQQTMQELVNAVTKIDEVVAIITDIADHTNLLALNATIEAARAGEAGKGFAVVASEVKNLATQTAEATREIQDHVGNVQSKTQKAANAMSDIERTISDINDVAAAIGGAVEDQVAATQEIAQNAEQASRGTTEMSSNMQVVTELTADAGSASGEVLTAAADLSVISGTLKNEVDQFLKQIRVN